MEIDTTNKFIVAAQGDAIRVMRPHMATAMSKDDALNLAAWLVALADPGGERFAQVLVAVCGT